MTMRECAQNDSGGVRAERQGRVCHSGERCFPAPPVILRSEGDEESLGHALGREGRFFAALRMTMGGAQNDNGGVRSE